ncbi:hypothetical protein HPS54_10765 [Prevotella sp. PCHR]|uniref:DUF2269 family protein n=1 Tax=Xylanibacter caecicola TaxID=2736294 RepID=A0ABX2B4V0_9BACT|nr:hypothetical protein [Xylanibacter caecicola]NPE25982.1 hypothetical protein [Xylanibacter caecicola]
MKLSAKGMKALKVVHLVCAIAWFGSAISMNLLRHLVDVNDAVGMYWMAEILEAIDMQILVPGAVGCLVTGIVYGIFTNWGFFKHKWLVLKWVLTIFMILFGTFYMGPLVKENVIIGKAVMEGGGDTALYWHNVSANAVAGLLQLILLTVVTVVSVYKPWKRSDKRR